MFCFIYKSNKKEQTYLYLNNKDNFSDVPNELMNVFGKPHFVMVINLSSRNKLAIVNIDKVKEALQNEGYFLQLPPPPVNLLDEYKRNKSNQ